MRRRYRRGKRAYLCLTLPLDIHYYPERVGKGEYLVVLDVVHIQYDPDRIRLILGNTDTFQESVTDSEIFGSGSESGSNHIEKNPAENRGTRSGSYLMLFKGGIVAKGNSYSGIVGG